MKSKAMILDFNDTIDDNFEVKREAMTKLLGAQGRGRNVDKVLVEIDKVDLMHPDWDMEKIVAAALKDVLPGVAESEANEIAKKYMQYRLKHARLNATFVKAAPKLAKKYKIILLTSGNKEKVMELMQRYKIKKYIARFYFTRELGIKKPSIDLLERIIKENNIDRRKSIVVGDDVIKDHMPAKLLGMKTVLYSKFVDRVISDFEKLL